MKKQYLYPQNMRTEAKLWFWGLKDIIILAIALTISVVSWAKLNFMIPAALNRPPPRLVLLHRLLPNHSTLSMIM